MPSHAAAITALVPLRTGGKTRLSPVLGPDERAALAGAMLADVTAALARAGVARTVVLAQGPAATAAAAALGLEVLADGPGTADLDAAIAHGTERLGPVDRLLVVAADLPALSGREVERLATADAPVVIAPTHDGGTGALLRRPATAIPTAYGRASAEQHRRLAEDAGVPAEVVDLPGFARDVDRPRDLAALDPADVGPATARVLERLRRDQPRRAVS